MARQGDGWFRTNVVPLFPERQIILRSRGRIRYVALSTRKQLTAAALAVVAMLAVVASIWDDHRDEARLRAQRLATVQENQRLQARLEEERARRQAQLAEMRQTYARAFRRLDEYDRTFADVAAEVDRLDASLRALIGEEDKVAEATPAVLAPVAVSCPRTSRQKIEALQAEVIKPPPPRDLPPTAQVRARLDRLRQTHRAFIDYYVEVASERVAEIDKALSAVGLDVETFLGEDWSQGRHAVGGPFVPVPAVGASPAWDGAYLASLSTLDLEMERWSGLATAVRTLPFGSPIEDGWISSSFGHRTDPINGRRGYHKGLDFGGPWRAPIRATGDGVVTKAGRDGGYGNVVEIDHGMGIRTRYAHLACVLVEKGQKVRRNTVVGLMGATGRTKGAHLHYEVRVAGKPRDPRLFLKAGEHVLEK